LKRVTVWVDSPDVRVDEVRKLLKEYLTQAGLGYMMSEAVEIIEKE
jgi:hypothetical protein